MKTCFKCLEVKPLSDFYVHKNMCDGHLNKCKECTKKEVSVREKRLKETNLVWYESELERHRVKAAKTRAAGKISPHTESGKNRWQSANKHKRKAHHAVNNAVRDKRFTKQPCEFCGSNDTQAHHDDYSKPLEVRWLCIPHHAQVHRELNRQRRLERFNAKNQAE
jgi:hypothetical protein